MSAVRTAPDALAAFAAWLASERRAAPNTVEAYTHDIGHFIGFLAGHLGRDPLVVDLAELSRHDVIAWLACRRSDDGLAASSRARA
ncbi:MAG: site-specific integrase, partial [Alphaproteobacteria bacterium]|nr:site-specific integrase [Alphaproteobacteria bacterium]